MRSGRRSVRLKVFVLLVVPLISVIALWAFAASVTVGDARRQLRTNAIADALVLPIAAVQNQLAPEALLSAVSMGSHRPADQRALAVQRAHTDGALGLLRTAVASDKVRGSTSTALRQQLTGFLQSTTSQLTEVRAGIDSGSGQRLQMISTFSDLAEVAEGVQEDIGAASLVDVAAYREALPLYPTGTGIALLTSEQAILLGAVSAGERALTQDEIEAFSQATFNRRLVLEKLVAGRTTPSLGTALQDILTSAPYATLTAYEDRIISAAPGSPLTVDPKAFQAASLDVSKQYAAVTRPLGLALGDRISKAGRPVVIRLALAGGLGLIAVLLSLLLSIRFGRGLTRELTGLQLAAQDLADRQLPRLIERLRNDEHIDVDAEAPPLKVGDTAEVARVGDAFTSVQRTAVEAAIGQANLRRGVRQVFLNLARRSQSLLHRQLTMLDAMERKTNDPDALDELFRLDHLTTRMRRHAEGLIILSGALPARAWSTPVRVVDVVRAAIAEVESYTRVRVYVLSEASLQGAVVADVTHLIAELVENAASFSPPHTQVQVRAESVGSGFVVEIEDAGLGMTPDQLADVNGRLAEPPDFDLADTDRLGLFVIAQLATRHNIKVTLRPSPYGGTTAIVLIPAELMATQEALAGGLDAEQARVRAASRRGPALPDDPDLELSEVVDVGPDEPVLTGRHRRLAGFLQRTRALQGPASEPERHENGHQRGPADTERNGNGWHPAQPDRPAAGADGGWPQPGRPPSSPPSSGAPSGAPGGMADRSDSWSGDRSGAWDAGPATPPGGAGYRPEPGFAAGADRPAGGWPGSPGPSGAGPSREPGPTARADRWEPAPNAGPGPDARSAERSDGRPGGRAAPGGQWESGPGGRPDGFRTADRFGGAARHQDDRTPHGPASDRQQYGGAAGRPAEQPDQGRGQFRAQPAAPDRSSGYGQVPVPRPGADSGRDARHGWDDSKFDLWATTESAATSAGTHAGLPRRVRRASLAPQLRDAPAADPDESEQSTDTLRSPEQARALLSSLQSGWQRGRTAADPDVPPMEEPR